MVARSVHGCISYRSHRWRMVRGGRSVLTPSVSGRRGRETVSCRAPCSRPMMAAGYAGRSRRWRAHRAYSRRTSPAFKHRHGKVAGRMETGRSGRGRPVSRQEWPVAGAVRDWLAFCDQVHEANGLPSLRTLAAAMGLASATRVGELLRGLALPADERQARDLLGALGAVGTETERGVRLYQAARYERVRAARDAGRPGWWLRSGYAAQISDIAPLELLGRQDELEELADWCASGDEAYAWWQAGPRAGKSALMAWLVLHPPPGTWVISFFVTARLASQADSAAFTDGLLDQLAAITGEPVPPLTLAAARDGLRRRLLEEAAARAVKDGRRLVLVVDGLDEDCGSLPGSGLASIAACLPKRPPAGLRVIVTGRPDPAVPADVDADHPLRHCRIRRLDVSPHATHAAQLAQRELDEVLAIDQDRHDGLGYEVLGLVTASGGGLGYGDLQELVGRPAFEIDWLLRGVFGRTVAGRVPRTPRPGRSYSPTRLCASRPPTASGRAPSPASPRACTPGPTATRTAAGPRRPRPTCCAATPACSSTPATANDLWPWPPTAPVTIGCSMPSAATPQPWPRSALPTPSSPLVSLRTCSPPCACHGTEISSRTATPTSPPSSQQSGQPSGSPSAPKPSPGLLQTRKSRRGPWPTWPGRWPAPAISTALGHWPAMPSGSPGPPPTRKSRRGP